MLKNSLLVGKGCDLIGNSSLSNEKNLFGELILGKSVSVKSTSELANFGLFYSKILSPNQALDLVKLCGFSNRDKFKLIYRASDHGFKSTDFHNHCDGIYKTLSIVKVKDSPFIFGGFTSVSWDSNEEVLFFIYTHLLYNSKIQK